MPELLIIYPHWHPANLAGVHRPRLTGNFLSKLGWKVHVLTVEERYFEEKPDPDFHRTFSPEFRVSRVRARPLRRPRIIGDIGLRAMPYIKRKALEIIKKEKIDFIWIPIPSFYMALVGPYLKRKTGVPYGIDYIDPWVRDLSNQKNLRAMLSQCVARTLEPRVVRKASLITGVSRNYYLPVMERNKLLERKPEPVAEAAFPYGFDPADHAIQLDLVPPPWPPEKKKVWLYTGAFLPNSHYLLELFFKTIAALKEEDARVAELYFCFLGTGPYPAKRIRDYAADYGISEQVLEIRERFPYLHTLNFQAAADTVMIIGSTEKHYTASKTYQSLLSRRPLFAVLHRESQAVGVLEECRADTYLVRYEEGLGEETLVKHFKDQVVRRLQANHWQPDLEALNKYSALESARKLAGAIEKIL